MAATESSVRKQARIFSPTGLGRGHGPLLRDITGATGSLFHINNGGWRI